MQGLKPSEEIMAASFSVATVVAIYGNYTAPVQDIQADAPNHQTHKDSQRAALVSAAIVSGIALLAKSPTVFIVGGITILLEHTVRAHANYTMPAATPAQ
jgi:hypothetical protein